MAAQQWKMELIKPDRRRMQVGRQRIRAEMKWGLTADVQTVPGRYNVGMEIVLHMQRHKGWKIKTKLEGTSAIGYHKWRQARVTNSWTASHSIWNHETLQLPSPGWWLTDLPVCSGHVSYLIIQHLTWFLWQPLWMLCHWNLSSAGQELLPDFFLSSTALYEQEWHKWENDRAVSQALPVRSVCCNAFGFH